MGRERILTQRKKEREREKEGILLRACDCVLTDFR